MKNLIFLSALLLSQLAFAVNRESGGGGPGKTLTCTDTFDPQAAGTSLTAKIIDANHLGPMTVQAKQLNGVKLNFSNMTLSPYAEAGVQVLTGADHAMIQAATIPPGVAFDPSFSVILTLGTDWLNAGIYSVGQVQFYCDECGGGIPTFQPNMYCRIQ